MQQFQRERARRSDPCGTKRFWNIAYFDEKYFKGMFEDFVFPDGDSMRWESVSWLQKRFMNWFNEERRRAVLTFPVNNLAA